MNVHGKNNFKVGPTGDHVLDFDLLAPDGRSYRCSREENADIFHAAIGGFGALGAFTRLRLQLKHVESGLLRVEGLRSRSLEETFEIFEQRLPDADYLVAWLDGVVGGRSLGRGIIHQASYLKAGADPEGPAKTLQIARQDLPASILGFPRSLVRYCLRPFRSNPGMRLVNAAQYFASYLHRPGHTYLQAHAAFAFLLDYVPNWWLAYGRAGSSSTSPSCPRSRRGRSFASSSSSASARGFRRTSW